MVTADDVFSADLSGSLQSALKCSLEPQFQQGGHCLPRPLEPPRLQPLPCPRPWPEKSPGVMDRASSPSRCLFPPLRELRVSLWLRLSDSSMIREIRMSGSIVWVGLYRWAVASCPDAKLAR